MKILYVALMVSVISACSTGSSPAPQASSTPKWTQGECGTPPEGVECAAPKCWCLADTPAFCHTTADKCHQH